MSDRFSRFRVNSPGNFDFFVPHEQRTAGVCIQFTGSNSFSAWLDMTSHISRTASGTLVGSNWIGTGLGYAGPNAIYLGDLNVSALRIRVDSVVGNLHIAAALNQ